MKRDGETYTGTRAEVVRALEESIVYYGQFGSELKARQAETAVTCVVGGSESVRVGVFTYRVTDGDHRTTVD